MRPGFGSRLREQVFAPITSTTKALIARAVTEALVQFEALRGALEDFRREGKAPGGMQAFEDFLGYKEFAARSRRYGS